MTKSAHSTSPKSVPNRKIETSESDVQAVLIVVDDVMMGKASLEELVAKVNEVNP